MLVKSFEAALTSVEECLRRDAMQLELDEQKNPPVGGVSPQELVCAMTTLADMLAINDALTSIRKVFTGEVSVTSIE